MAAYDRKIAASLLAVILFLIVFGSLYPFSFAANGSSPVDLLRGLSFAGTTRSDVAANVLLYLPLGACLAWLSSARFSGPVAVVTAVISAAALSFAIEFAQLYETRRVTSLADFACNTIGALAGACLALAISRTRNRLHLSPLAGVLRHPVAAALLVSWVGYRLAPFAPVFEPAKWASAFSPLTDGDWLRPSAVLPHLVAWLVLVMICGRLASRRPIAIVAVAMACVLAGRVLFAGMALEPAEVTGMAAALALAHPLARLPVPRAAFALAVALMALIVIEGSAPFNFQLAQDRFALLPFGESLTHYRATNLADVFLRCFTNGSLVWLLALGGLSVLAATSLGAAIVFAIELLQTWLPGQTAEITNPLLAVCAGGLIAVFERDANGK